MSILDEAPEWADEEFDGVERDLRAKQQRPVDDVVDLPVLDEQTKVQLAKQVSQATVPGAVAEHDRCNNLHAKASQGQLKEMGNLRWIQKNRRGAEHTWGNRLPSERSENATEEQPIDDFPGRMHDIRSKEDMREDEELKKRRRRRAKWCLLAVLVVLILVGTGVGIAVTIDDSSTQKDTPTNDAEVIPLFRECYMRSNETVPSDRFTHIQNVVAAAWTWGDSSIDSDPQRAALCWLSEVDNFTLATAPEADYEVVQRFALATMFYHIFGVSTNVEGDRRNTEGFWRTGENWLEGVHVCQLDGVGCDGPNNRVTEFESQRIPTFIRQIPEEIALLSDLVHLRMTSSGWGGQIPSAISVLTNLQLLDLSWNSLTGTIPSELGGLSELHILNFAGNDIDGQIPTQLGGLSKLHTLNFAGNDIGGQIPTELGGLSKLHTLDFAGNDIEGQIPTQLFQIPALRHLNLSTNRITGTLPGALKNSTRLAVIHLGGTSLSGTIPAGVDTLTSLRELILGYTNINGSIPTTIGNLSALRILDLSSLNGLTGTIPTELAHLSRLDTLLLPARSNLSGGIPDEVCNLPSPPSTVLPSDDGFTLLHCY